MSDTDICTVCDYPSWENMSCKMCALRAELAKEKEIGFATSAELEAERERSTQAVRVVADLQLEGDRLRAELAAKDEKLHHAYEENNEAHQAAANAETELAQWKTWGVAEIAVRN